MSWLSPCWTAARLGGLMLVLSCVLIRAMTSHDPLPYWGVDPLHFAEPLIGVGPMEAMILDVLTMFGAGLILLGEARRVRPQSDGHRGGILLVPLILALLGCAGPLLHGFVLRGFSLDDVRIGGTWTAGVLAALALVHGCRDPRTARLVVALCIAAVMMLAAKGAVQVLVEHPEMVRQYEQNKDAYIAAQGWAPGSTSVRAFERRLRQAEATGWFGLSNVFASFAAMGVVALGGWAVLAVRARREFPDGWLGVLLLGLFAAIAALLLAQSKGGLAAAGLGTLLVILALTITLQPTVAGRFAKGLQSFRAGGVVAIAAVFLALAAVMLRGAIGERISELSLLFRWFYMQGAVRIFAEHPLVGVGPANFKEAYLLAKPPLSPEEVLSPHSILLDLSATLGTLGVAWCTFWLWLLFRGGQSLIPLSLPPAHTPRTPVATPAPSARELRLDAWFCVLIPFAVLSFGLLSERQALTPDSALMRMVGLIAWVGVAIAAVAAMRVMPWRIPAAAAAITLAIHSQIEVTPVWQASAPLAWILMGAVAGSALAVIPNRSPSDGSPVPGHLAALALLGIAAGWSWFGLRALTSWQAALTSSAHLLHPVADLRLRLQTLDGSGNDSMPDIAADLAELAGGPVPRSSAEFDRAMHQLVVARSAAAAPQLQVAADIAPSHVATVEALARLHLTRAMALGALSSPAAADAAQAAEDLVAGLVSRSPSAAAFNLQATVGLTRFELDGDRSHLRAAADALTRAEPLDPFGLAIPLRLVNLHLMMGNEREAARWARTALERNHLQRLDPLRQLPPEERQKMEALARSVETDPGGSEDSLPPSGGS